MSLHVLAQGTLTSDPVERTSAAGAVLIALPETASGRPHPATREEAAELSRLVAAVATCEGFTQAETAEALSHALCDPGSALRCLWALLKSTET